MHNICIVIGREYLTRVRKRSFLILTILVPFLIVGIVTLPFLLGSVKDDKERPVAIIDKTGRYMPLFTEAQKTDISSSRPTAALPHTIPTTPQQMSS